MITLEEGRAASNCMIFQTCFLLVSENQSLHHCIPCCAKAVESWALFCCQLQREKLGQQLLFKSGKTLLSETVLCFSLLLHLAVVRRLTALRLHYFLSTAPFFILAVAKLHFIQKLLKQLNKSRISVPARWAANAVENFEVHATCHSQK